MAGIIGEYYFMISWQFLGHYSTSGLYKVHPPLQEVISHSDQFTTPGELGLDSSM
jgi:hypothetical protein